MIHRVLRPDADPWLHNHPWDRSRFLIVSGGYTEERGFSTTGRGAFLMVEARSLNAGDVNHLNANTFHRIADVMPNTWTIGLVGERVQDWGFWVDGRFIESKRFFAMKQYKSSGGHT